MLPAVPRVAGTGPGMACTSWYLVPNLPALPPHTCFYFYLLIFIICVDIASDIHEIDIHYIVSTHALRNVRHIVAVVICVCVHRRYYVSASGVCRGAPQGVSQTPASASGCVADTPEALI